MSATSPLRVLDLRGNGYFKLRHTTDIVAAKAQDEARTFSQGIYDATGSDGILCRSRLRNRQDCIAVYDRAVAASLAAGPVLELETLASLVLALRVLKVKLIA